MIIMKGVLKVAMTEVEDTMVDLEDEAMVVEEVSSFMKHVIYAVLLTTTGVNVLRILHVFLRKEP